MNFDHITFANIIDTTINVVNSGPAMFAISTLAFIISRRLNRLNEQAVYDRIVKQGNAKIKTNYDLAKNDIKRRVNEANEYIKAHQPSAVEQAAKVVEQADNSFSDAKIEGFDIYSHQEKLEIIEALNSGTARIGRTRLGRMNFDIDTGRKIN